jgi:hypothetical protein
MDTVGVGSNDTVEVAGSWVFTCFKENARALQGILGFDAGTSRISLTLLGDYNSADLVLHAGQAEAR